MGMKVKLGLVAGLVMAAAWSQAAEVAVLRNGYSIRHERRAIVGSNTRLFTGADDSSFVDVPTAEIERIEPDLTPPVAPPPQEVRQPAPTVAPQAALPGPVDLSHAVNAASDRYRLDPDLVNSVIRAESGFNPRAVSPKGARGLMQLMPQTASKLGVPNAFDPEANVDGGTRYLRELLELYNFDLIKALAAYNAGPHRVQQYGGVPPYRETRHYVASIVRDFNRKKIAEQKAAQANQHQTAKTAPPAKTPQTASTQPKSQSRVTSTPKRTTPANTGN